jgi:hypothetical protein
LPDKDLGSLYLKSPTPIRLTLFKFSRAPLRDRESIRQVATLKAGPSLSIQFVRRRTGVTVASRHAHERQQYDETNGYGNGAPLPSMPQTVMSPSIGEPSIRRIMFSRREDSCTRYSAR